MSLSKHTIRVSYVVCAFIVYIATKWVLFCKRVVRNSTIYIVIGDEREMCRRVDLRNLYMKSVSVACCVCVSDFVWVVSRRAAQHFVYLQQIIEWLCGPLSATPATSSNPPSICDCGDDLSSDEDVHLITTQSDPEGILIMHQKGVIFI